MSGPSTYNPKSGLERWIDARLPLPRLLHDTVHTFPTPRNLNIWYTFGGILTFCLAIQIVTESVDRKSTRLNSSHVTTSRMPSSA